MSATTLPPGFRAAGTHCGLKADGVLDLGLILADEPQRVHALRAALRRLRFAPALA